MPELDTVRGIAILLVVFFHGFSADSAGLSGLPRLFVTATKPGWMGVNLFFVLSGFLITGILLDGRQQPHFYRNFYIRRALRILPAYYLLLLILWLVPRLGIVDHRRISLAFLGLSFVYLANVTNLFGVTMQYGPLWTLAVEEHFYLLWPSAVRLCSRRQLAYVAGAVFVACPLLRAIGYGLGYEYGNGYTWLVADGLATGALLAIFCRRPGTDRRAVLSFSLACMASAALLLLIGLPFGILLSRTLLGGSLRATMLNVFFAGALAGTLLLGSSPWRQLVQGPVLGFFGGISYGLYLIHMLVFDISDHFAALYFPRLSDVGAQGHFGRMVARFLIAGSISVAIALFSRRTIEARFLSFKDRWTVDLPETVKVQARPATLVA